MSRPAAQASEATGGPGWDLARLAVRGAAEQAIERQLPELAGTLTLQVLGGLQSRVRERVDLPLADADALASEAMSGVLDAARRVAEQAALSEAAGLARWQGLGPVQAVALESLAHLAAEGAAQKAVQTAGRVSITFLAEAHRAQQDEQGSLSRVHHGAAPRTQAEPVAGHGQPPALAEALLGWLLPERDRDCLLADLQEELETCILPRCSPEQARAWYWRQAMGSVVPLARMRLHALLGRLWSWIPG